MSAYTNVISRVGPAGSVFSALYQKTDFLATDALFTSPGSYWIGASGVLQPGQFSDKAFDLTGFTKAQVTAIVSPLVGTAPTFALLIALYDNDSLTGSSYDSYSVGASLGAGATHATILGNSAGAVTFSNIDLVPALPTFARLAITTGGTITGIGAATRISLFGLR